MQRILAMQQAVRQRPELPSISDARQQGQIMGPNYNPGNGIAALRRRFAQRAAYRAPPTGPAQGVMSNRNSAFRGVVDKYQKPRLGGPSGPRPTRPAIPVTSPYGKYQKPQLGGPGGLPDTGQVVGSPNPGIDAMRSRFSDMGDYNRRQPFGRVPLERY